MLSCPGQSHTVVAGDTLYAIAQRFLGDGALWVELTKPDGTHFTEVEAENLEIGQMVCIPGPSTGSKVLNFLQSISGSQTVAGQHNREPNSEPAMWTDWIYNNTGKYPGLWSGDFLYEQPCISNRATMINEAKTQWQQGALMNLMYHACPPTTGEPCAWEGGVLSSLMDDQWNELITDGSDLNNNWKARLDALCALGGENFKVLASRPDKERVIVTSGTQINGAAPIRVDWQLNPTNHGYKVTDVIVNGISMASTQDSDLISVIQRNGGQLPALLVALRDKNASNGILR